MQRHRYPSRIAWNSGLNKSTHISAPKAILLELCESVKDRRFFKEGVLMESFELVAASDAIGANRNIRKAKFWNDFSVVWTVHMVFKYLFRANTIYPRLVFGCIIIIFGVVRVKIWVTVVKSQSQSRGLAQSRPHCHGLVRMTLRQAFLRKRRSTWLRFVKCTSGRVWLGRHRGWWQSWKWWHLRRGGGTYAELCQNLQAYNGAVIRCRNLWARPQTYHWDTACKFEWSVPRRFDGSRRRDEVRNIRRADTGRRERAHSAQ